MHESLKSGFILENYYSVYEDKSYCFTAKKYPLLGTVVRLETCNASNLTIIQYALKFISEYFLFLKRILALVILFNLRYNIT